MVKRYHGKWSAVNGGGVEEWEEAVTAQALFDGSGEWVGMIPNAPADLQVRPQVGGTFLLQWTYPRESEEIEPSEFRVYNDSGTGTINYSTVVDTVSHRRGRLHFSYTSTVFADGTRVRWAVRAVSAGAEEKNTNNVFDTADSAAPPINPVVWITRG